MIVVQWLIFALAMATLVPFICRLTSLNFRTHAWSVIAMHLCMTASVAWGGFWAWEHKADFGHFCGILGPLLWIIISYASWMHEVPTHYRRSSFAPYDVHPDHFERIYGGRGE